MIKEVDEWKKLVDIKQSPDLGGTPEMLETTTMSDPMQTFILGIETLSDGLPFTSNYTKADYEKLLALKDQEKEFAVWFGGTEEGGVVTPDGSEGKFSFKGRLSVYVNGHGINEVVNMTVTIAPSTPITMDEGE